MTYEYIVYASNTGEVLEIGECTEEEKDGIKEEWPSKDGYEIDFQPIITAEEENRMQGLWQEQMH